MAGLSWLARVSRAHEGASAANAELIIDADVHLSGLLAFWARYSRQDLKRCIALEVGARHGGLSLWLASQGAVVVCSDRKGPTPRVRGTHKAAGVEGRVRYEEIDATAIPYENKFDILIFKTVLGAVGGTGGGAAQVLAVAQMHKALKVNGELLFAESLAASSLHRALRRRCTGWGRRWRYLSKEQMCQLLSCFSTMRYQTGGVVGLLGRTPSQRRLLGQVDRVLDAIVPPRWHTMMIGVARK